MWRRRVRNTGVLMKGERARRDGGNEKDGGGVEVV